MAAVPVLKADVASSCVIVQHIGRRRLQQLRKPFQRLLDVGFGHARGPVLLVDEAVAEIVDMGQPAGGEEDARLGPMADAEETLLLAIEEAGDLQHLVQGLGHLLAVLLEQVLAIGQEARLAGEGDAVDLGRRTCPGRCGRRAECPPSRTRRA